MRLLPSYVWDQLPMEEGWALHAWAMENDGWLGFNNVQRGSQGYVAQEIDRLMSQIPNG